MNKILILFLLSTSFSTFASSHLDFTLSDFCYQQPNVQKRGDVYYLPNEEVGISALSICVYKDAYGQYQSKGRLINGKVDGKQTKWYKNGQKRIETNFKEDRKHGKWTQWFENGQISNEFIYKNGKKDVKQTRWYENGQIKQDGNYKDGIAIGKWTAWYEDGQILQELNYKDGKRDGKHTFWYEDGQIRAEVSWIDDKLDGKFTKWDENGQIKDESNYKEGKLYSIVDRHENGQIKSALYYSNDSWNGKYEGWHDNGTKSYEGTFYLEKFNAVSEHINWDRNGNVESSGTLEIRSFKKYKNKGLDNALKIGLWTYRVNNQIVSEGSYANGKKHGEWVFYSVLEKKILNFKDGEAVEVEEELIIVQEQLEILKNAWVSNIAALVRSNWRISGPEDDWFAEVTVYQDRDGNVKAVGVNTNAGDSQKAKAFMDSIERAVYKSSPLPPAPDEAVFDNEIYMVFSVN
jgi:antitoxin component YwqK of YwqJK toxin-antitoxin module